jgi:succinyl-CoA synthetase beta subunit
MRLKAAKLLLGFRNTPPADVEAAAEIAHRIGQLMLQQAQLMEIDINPLMVHAKGDGATALDALIVTKVD